jgi:hypothetical protein
MTLHTLVALLIAWPLRPTSPVPTDQVLPDWERNPVEQKFLREERRKVVGFGSGVPRLW